MASRTLLCLTMVLAYTTMCKAEKETNEARYLSPYQSGHGHYGGAMTCTCAVIGQEGPIRQQLEQWVDPGYYDGSSYQDDRRPRQCVGRACYRADFIGVGQEHGYYHYNRNHYTVLGCVEPRAQSGSWDRTESIEFTVHANISLDHFLYGFSGSGSGYYGGGHQRVRKIYEFVCSHYLCQNMEPAPYHLWNYYRKIEECVGSSANRFLVNGLSGLVIAVIALVFAQGDF